MKKILRIAVVLTVIPILSLSLLETATPARAGSGVNPAARLPWKAQIFDDDLNTNRISVAFGGDHQYPIIGYEPANSSVSMRLAMPAVHEVGNCGPGGKWFCMNAVFDSNGYTSRIATFNYRDSFKVGYIYKDSFLPEFYLVTREYSNDLEYLTSSAVPILHLNIYNSGISSDWRLTAPPVFAYDEVGNPHIAAVLQFGGGYKVLYIHKVTSGQPTTPCLVNPLVNPTLFQCDIIYESSVPFINSDSIKIVISAAGTPRILFFQSNGSGTADALMYAYPTTLHGNCGPGGTTWRCIPLDTQTANVDFYIGGGSDHIVMDMAIGPKAPHIVAKAYNSAGTLILRYIRWVGTNGNCGTDYIGIGPIMDERWSCTDVAWGGDLAANSSISLQVDSLDYPVIALTWPTSDHYQVGVYYPAERAGSSYSFLWHFDKVDGTVYDTGMSVSFALDRAGRGFMAYTELEDYDPNLKIAYQDPFKVHLPMIKR